MKILNDIQLTYMHCSCKYKYSRLFNTNSKIIYLKHNIILQPGLIQLIERKKKLSRLETRSINPNAQFLRLIQQVMSQCRRGKNLLQHWSLAEDKESFKLIPFSKKTFHIIDFRCNMKIIKHQWLNIYEVISLK